MALHASHVVKLEASSRSVTCLVLEMLYHRGCSLAASLRWEIVEVAGAELMEVELEEQ